MQQNNKCRLCGDRDEIINHIKRECNKSAQQAYKTRHDWVGKVIYRELSWKLKFNHTNQWFMHNTESVLENKTRKPLFDLEIQTDCLISFRRPDLMMVYKKENLLNSGLCRSIGPPSENKRKQREKYLDLAR